MRTNKFIYLFIILVLGVASVLYYNPPAPNIYGVTADQMVSSIAKYVEHEYKKVKVYAVTYKPNLESNSTIIQYTIYLDIEPRLLDGQPTTQEEYIQMQKAFETMQGAFASILRYSATLMGKFPAVLQLNMTVIFKDGTIMQGGAQSEQLKAIPINAQDKVWLEALTLAPTVVVFQSIWEDLLKIEAVQQRLSRE